MQFILRMPGPPLGRRSEQQQKCESAKRRDQPFDAGKPSHHRRRRQIADPAGFDIDLNTAGAGQQQAENDVTGQAPGTPARFKRHQQQRRQRKSGGGSAQQCKRHGPAAGAGSDQQPGAEPLHQRADAAGGPHVTELNRAASEGFDDRGMNRPEAAFLALVHDVADAEFQTVPVLNGTVGDASPVIDLTGSGSAILKKEFQVRQKGFHVQCFFSFCWVTVIVR